MDSCQFSMTVEGCAEATEYLRKVGEMETFERNKTSVDGFSLVAYANHEARKRQVNG